MLGTILTITLILTLVLLALIGYAACVAADALNRSRGTMQFQEIRMIDKPAMYE